MSACRSVISMPSIKTDPAVGISSRFSERRSVDLPEPDGPMMTTTSPRRTLRSMPSSALILPRA